MAKKSTPQIQGQEETRADVATRFKPGQSGNPGGKPAGARNRLQAKFLNSLADDFEEHGVAAIVAMRTEDPVAYVRAVASLMPKEIEVTNPLQELSDDALIAAVNDLREFLQRSASANQAGGDRTGKDGSGAQASRGRNPAAPVPSIH